jgi:hypothetical protein
MTRYKIALHKKPKRKKSERYLRVVVQTLLPLDTAEFYPEVQSSRKWGVKGVIIASHDSHGLCYEVEHEDGTIGAYTPREIKLWDDNPG